MLDVPMLINSFEQIVGWPYPPKDANGNYGGGATDDRGKDPAYGIDCSGAYVRAYRQQGSSIYHGSNRIIRVYCHDQAIITAWEQLKLVAAVFKARGDVSKMSSTYKKGGQYYNAGLANDYYHIGLITGLEPLTVIHATTPKAQKDVICTRKDGETDANYRQRAVAALIKAGWTWQALLNAVPYESTAAKQSGVIEPSQTAPVVIGTSAMVTAANGKPVKMRAEASLLCRLYWEIPVGTTVALTGHNKTGWTGIKYGGKAGFMQNKFLETL